MNKPVTLEEVRSDLEAVTEKLAKLEAQQKPRTLTVAGRTLTLKAGEKYVGTIATPDFAYDLILLPGEFQGNHAAAMKWAEKQGGELFDRVEGALLFATKKSEFKEEWYWTRETSASNDACAWGQYFLSGSQGYIPQGQRQPG